MHYILSALFYGPTAAAAVAPVAARYVASELCLLGSHKYQPDRIREIYKYYEAW